MAIKNRSAKNKGYRFQRDIRDLLLEKFTNLLPEEIVSAPSSINGEDLILSDKARTVLGNVNFEAKRHEKINVWSSLEQAELESKKRNTNPILIFRRNRSNTYATIQLEFLLQLLYNNMLYQELITHQNIDMSKLKEIFNDKFLDELFKK